MGTRGPDSDGTDAVLPEREERDGPCVGVVIDQEGGWSICHGLARGAAISWADMCWRAELSQGSQETVAKAGARLLRAMGTGRRMQVSGSMVWELGRHRRPPPPKKIDMFFGSGR